MKPKKKPSKLQRYERGLRRIARLIEDTETFDEFFYSARIVVHEALRGPKKRKGK